MGRNLRVVVCGVSAAAIVATAGALARSANATAAYGVPTGWPSLAPAALAPEDLPAGARVDGQGYVKPDSSALAEYDRSFAALSTSVNGKRLLALEDDVSIGRSAGEADGTILALPLGAAIVAPQISKQLGKALHLKVKYTKLGRFTGLGVGNNSTCVVIRIGTKLGEIRLVLAGIRVGQVDSVVVLAGVPRAQVGVAEARALGRLVVKRVTGAMSPQNTVPPTATGALQVGQTLTATPGTWLGFATGYGYQWQRCDATGANCADIAGATATTYVTTADDANMTLRVEVAATNAYGTAPAVPSAPTAVVTPPPPPAPSG